MENNQRLRLNVNVFTEIIKEKVSEYIYYEIGNMESMRVKLEKEIMHTMTDHIDSCIVFVSDNMEIY